MESGAYLLWEQKRGHVSCVKLSLSNLLDLKTRGRGGGNAKIWTRKPQLFIQDAIYEIYPRGATRRPIITMRTIIPIPGTGLVSQSSSPQALARLESDKYAIERAHTAQLSPTIFDG